MHCTDVQCKEVFVFTKCVGGGDESRCNALRCTPLCGRIQNASDDHCRRAVSIIPFLICSGKAFKLIPTIAAVVGNLILGREIRCPCSKKLCLHNNATWVSGTTRGTLGTACSFHEEWQANFACKIMNHELCFNHLVKCHGRNLKAIE